MIKALKWAVLFSAMSWSVFGTEAAARGRGRDAARISFTFTPSVPLAGSTLRLSRTNYNIGGEVSAGGDVRYHLALLYGNLVGQSTFRVEPLAFGLPIELFDGSEMSMDLEPVLSFLNAGFIVSGPNAQVVFSSGARLQLNISIDRFYLGLVPIGFDIRYYGNKSGGGTAVDYRPQVFIGGNFD